MTFSYIILIIQLCVFISNNLVLGLKKYYKRGFYKMNEKTIFIFEAEEEMILSKDVVMPDGHLILPAGTPLTYEIIERISNFHILEIMVESEPDGTNDLNETITPTYFTKIRQSDSFKKFNANYQYNISAIKINLNKIITSSSPVDTETLLKEATSLLKDTQNSLHLFDMLHSMREFDDITYVHSINVALISHTIGEWLGCKKEDLETLMLCGLLHDIGKLLIPSEILLKPEKLTSIEFDVIKTHVSLGYNELKDKCLDNRINEACLLHHERCDGSGYPFGIKGDKIPFAAKIVAIADVYDAMTSNRIYRGSICPFEVIRIMEADAFNQFDPKYLIPFLNNVISTYLHNDVKLSNGLVGEVIIINRDDLSRPTVRCNDEYIDLSKHREINIQAIL